MKKITLKITAFLCFTMFAFQGYAQFVSTIVEGTKYNLINVGTGSVLKATGDGAYEFAGSVDTADNTFNFTFWHHNTTDPGVDGVLGTGDDVVHNYLTDWNIQGDVRGIMRAANPGTVHTNFKYNQSFNTNGGHKTDKRFEETFLDQGGTPTFRFSPLTGDRFLYEGIDGVLYNYDVATMNDAGEANTDGEARSYWVVQASTVVLSNEEFDTSSIFIANPVKNALSIKGLTSNVKQVSVYSLLGQEVLSKRVNAQSSLSIDVSTLTSGMYLVEMKGDNGSFTKKIVKE